MMNSAVPGSPSTSPTTTCSRPSSTRGSRPAAPAPAREPQRRRRPAPAPEQHPRAIARRLLGRRLRGRDLKKSGCFATSGTVCPSGLFTCSAGHLPLQLVREEGLLPARDGLVDLVVHQEVEQHAHRRAHRRVAARVLAQRHARRGPVRLPGAARPIARSIMSREPGDAVVVVVVVQVVRGSPAARCPRAGCADLHALLRREVQLLDAHVAVHRPVEAERAADGLASATQNSSRPMARARRAWSRRRRTSRSCRGAPCPAAGPPPPASRAPTTRARRRRG